MYFDPTGLGEYLVFNWEAADSDTGQGKWTVLREVGILNKNTIFFEIQIFWRERQSHLAPPLSTEKKCTAVWSRLAEW